MFATYGNPSDVRIHTVVDQVEPCVVPAAESDRVCTPQDPITPAAKAGLLPGDRFVAFNGTPVTDWEQMQRLIRGNDDGEAVIVVERDGRQLTLRTNTTVAARPTSATDDTLVQVGFLGVSPTTTLGQRRPRLHGGPDGDA